MAKGRSRREGCHWRLRPFFHSSRVCLFVVLLLQVLFFLLLLLLLLLLWLPPLLLVDVLTADDLVNDPVENVKNEEDEREGHARHSVDAFGPADEELLHLLDAFLGRRRGRGVVVVALDGHAVLGVQTGGAHAVAREAEAPLARLVLLQQRPRLSLVGATGTRHAVGRQGRLTDRPRRVKESMKY